MNVIRMEEKEYIYKKKHATGKSQPQENNGVKVVIFV